MKNRVSTILKCSVAWTVVLATLILLLFFSSLIPNEAIARNVQQSALTLMETEPQQQLIDGVYHSTQDNYADAVLLNVLYNINSSDLSTMFNTMYYDGDGKGESYGLYASVEGTEPNTDYTRYWHGSVILLRLLLLVTDISGIRTFGAVICIILFVLNLCLLWRKRALYAGVILLASLLLVQSFYAVMSIEMTIILVVMLAFCPFYIRFYESNDRIIVLSAICGTVTAFTDFLTTETTVLLIPLLMVYLLRLRRGGFGGFRKEVALLLRSGAAWCGCYGLCFVLKWVLASVATGDNKFTTALTAMQERIVGSVSDEGTLIQVFRAVGANISALFPTSSVCEIACVVAGLAIAVAAITVFVLFLRKKAEKGVIPLFVIIAVIPLLRFALLSNHSLIHSYFTYRALAVTIVALVGLYAVTIVGRLPAPKTVMPKNCNDGEPELTILMPCLNEAKTLGRCVADAKSFIEQHGINGEIIVADNNSTDDSVKIANSSGARVVSVSERGYGNALIGAIKAARGEYIIMGDCDMSYDFGDSEGIFEKLREGFPLVVGNRFAGGIEKGAMPFSHKLGVPFLSLAGRLRYGSDVHDFHCGLRGFHRNTAISLGLSCGGMEFATEIIALFTKCGYAVGEVPVKLRKDDRNGKSHLRSVRDGLRHLLYIIKG